MRDKIISLLRTKNIEIPDNENEIINLFLGALIVGNIDYWLEWTFDFIDNEQPKIPFEREWSEVAQKDKAYRTSFTQLDNETKTQFKKLLQESIEGIVFSTLLRFDENWTISFDGDNIKGIANENGELHEDLYKWIELFGQNKDK